jgi:hypothetical protein
MRAVIHRETPGAAISQVNGSFTITFPFCHSCPFV